MSNSPGLVDLAIGLLNSVLNLPDSQVKFFEEFKLRKNCEINCVRLVNVSFSLPEWQAVKMTFFAPCSYTEDLNIFDTLFYSGVRETRISKLARRLSQRRDRGSMRLDKGVTCKLCFVHVFFRTALLFTPFSSTI